MNGDKAPTCPISYNQEPANPRGTAALRLPSIPIATDLPSLIRSVNIIRDILRTLTTSLTVNNFYEGKVTPSKQYGKKDYLMSDYFSEWYQTKIEPLDGVIYNKSAGKIDRKQKAYINRINAVTFRNNARDNSQALEWRYLKKPDGSGSGDEVFEEDYFERITNVKWKKKEQPPTYTAMWFYQVTAHGTGSHVPESGCVPWAMVSPSWVGLFGIDTGGIWSPPKLFGKRLGNQDIIVSGEPTGSGSGSTSDHWLTHAGVYPDSLSTKNRESIDIRVLAWPMLPAQCYGYPEYPPPPIVGFWSAFCRMAERGLGQFGLFGTPGSDFQQIGTMTVNASGISATTKDGKPLKKRKTTMTYSGNAYAGTVTVEFIDPDNPPKP